MEIGKSIKYKSSNTFHLSVEKPKIYYHIWSLAVVSLWDIVDNSVFLSVRNLIQL